MTMMMEIIFLWYSPSSHLKCRVLNEIKHLFLYFMSCLCLVNYCSIPNIEYTARYVVIHRVAIQASIYTYVYVGCLYIVRCMLLNNTLQS